MKERRFTPNVPGSEKTEKSKNGRTLLKVKCASCGKTKTRFIAAQTGKAKGHQKTRGGALARRRGPSTTDKIAYVASNFVTPAPSFAAFGRLLAGQAFKGVKDNVDYFRRARR